MAIRFKCLNDHALVANDRDAGHAMCCPVCGRAVVVPTPVVDAPQRDHGDLLTDTNVVRMLNDQGPANRHRVWA